MSICDLGPGVWAQASGREDDGMQHDDGLEDLVARLEALPDTERAAVVALFAGLLGVVEERLAVEAGGA